MKIRNIDIDDEKNLLLRIYTIGYRKRGESIVVLLQRIDTSDVIFSMVIDCCKLEKTNVTSDILSKFEISDKKPLDVLCWSHPDLDHSLGIDEIYSQYCDGSTKVVVPVSFWSKDYNIRAFNPNPREEKFLDDLLKINAKNLYTLEPTYASQGCANEVYKFNLQAQENTIHVVLYVLSPSVERLKGLIDSHIDGMGTKPPKRNQVSVTLLLDIEGFRFYFASDIPNEEIALLDESRLEELKFVKIPHHGSSSSSKLLDYIHVDRDSMACTTVFVGKKLPEEEVINLYRSRFPEVYTTGSSDQNKYGIVQADYDLFGAHSCDITFHGSALDCN